MKITMQLSDISIDETIAKLEAYQKSLEAKAKLLCERLAYIGQFNAQISFASVIYDGDKDFKVTVEETEKGFKVLASGETVLLLEFGAGITYGYGHPLADDFGMGPGTYPDGKGHWNSPYGWWLPKSAGGGHTWGNAPGMPMYYAAKDIRAAIEDAAREVFAT